MNKHKRTERMNLRVAPELKELINLIKSSPYAAGYNNMSEADLFTQLVADYTFRRTTFPAGVFDRAMALAQALSIK